MHLSTVLAQLRRELVNLDGAIVSLERLQSEAVRRGRPRRVAAELLKTLPKQRPAPPRQARRSRPTE